MKYENGMMTGDMALSEQEILSIFDRRLEAVFPSREEAVGRLLSKSGLRIYLGIDPTGQLHIGHLVPLMFLKKLADLGQRPVIVVGDFTATIGDPTGKDKARTAQTEEEVRENMEGYLDQIKKILPDFDVEYNGKWLKTMTFADVVQLASHVTIQQMIVRDMFQERLKQEKPIYVHEFLYPLMQGYDSVAMEIDGEVGGNDQTFNMLVGRELEKEYLKKDKLVFATKLLQNETGKKMSKSEGAFIALSDEPQEIRRKVLALDDGLTGTIFRLCTDRELTWIEEQEKALDARQLKELLADELISMLHGLDALGEARKPTEVSGELPLAQALKSWGAASSMSEAKELISGGGVRVNGVPQTDWNSTLKSGDDVQVGKGKFYKIK